MRCRENVIALLKRTASQAAESLCFCISEGAQGFSPAKKPEYTGGFSPGPSLCSGDQAILEAYSAIAEVRGRGGHGLIFRYRGLTFFFYSNEGTPREPIHIHAEKNNIEAKFWLKPEVRLAYNDGYDARTLRELLEVIEANKDRIESLRDVVRSTTKA